MRDPFFFLGGRLQVATFFVVNPAAGRGRAGKAWQQIQEALRGIGEWDFACTTGPGQATELARRAAERGYRRVVALGGDGTVLEVLNGILGTAAALGIVPAGTGNDYAREAGIPFKPLAAARFAMTGPELATDVGEVTLAKRRTYFLNVAGAGFDAEVARAVNRFPKFLGGTVPYLLGLAKTLWQYRSVPMAIRVDGRDLSRPVFLAAAGLSRTFGGGMRILPDARVDDGLLDLCLVRDLPALEVLRLVPKVYRGAHKGHPRVELLRCRQVEFEPARPVAVQADGEVLGTLPGQIRVLPGAVRLVAAPGVPVRSRGGGA